jgi:hypothetical protein
MILHFSHIGLTEGRTFMFPSGWLYREEAQAGGRPPPLPSSGDFGRAESFGPKRDREA